jgi:hypothetical protein
VMTPSNLSKPQGRDSLPSQGRRMKLEVVSYVFYVYKDLYAHDDSQSRIPAISKKTMDDIY